jgi:hypothetical protein
MQIKGIYGESGRCVAARYIIAPLGFKNIAVYREVECEKAMREKKWRPQGDLNPCRRRERAVSWARLDDGDAGKKW